MQTVYTLFILEMTFAVACKCCGCGSLYETLILMPRITLLMVTGVLQLQDSVSEMTMDDKV